MTKSEIMEAFREAASAEFIDIPNSDEIKHDFSPEFEAKMQKLIRSQKSFCWNLVSTTRRKALVIAAVIVLLTVSVFSVGAVRDTAKEYLITAFEKYFTLDTQKTELETIDYVYSFSEIPEGFECVDCLKSDGNITTIYDNGKGNLMIVEQIIRGESNVSVDSEMGEVVEIMSGDKKVVIYKNERVSSAFWIEDEYEMSLSYHGEISTDEMSKLIQAIK